MDLVARVVGACLIVVICILLIAVVLACNASASICTREEEAYKLGYNHGVEDTKRKYKIPEEDEPE